MIFFSLADLLVRGGGAYTVSTLNGSDVRELDGGGLVKAQWGRLVTVLALKGVLTATVTQYSTPGCRYVMATSSLNLRLSVNWNTTVNRSQQQTIKHTLGFNIFNLFQYENQSFIIVRVWAEICWWAFFALRCQHEEKSWATFWVNTFLFSCNSEVGFFEFTRVVIGCY